MSNVRMLFIGAIFCFTFVLVSPVNAKKVVSENQKDTLQGLKQVRLVVNIGFSREGPSKQRIQEEIEEQLKTIPIRVLPEDTEESNWLPALIIDVTVLKIDRRTFFFLATARLYQKVSLIRDANIFGPGITWRHWLIGEGNIDDIREKVKKVIDVFIGDYTSVNEFE